MIINYPTGLYKSELPSKPSDSTSVVYTISNEEPPKDNSLFVILPTIEDLKSLPEKLYTKEEKRQFVEELIYTITTSSRSDPGSNRKLFEVGDLLEFDYSDKSKLNNDNTPNELIIQHNTNIIDLDDLGLTTEEINKISSDSFNEKDKLERQLTEAKVVIDNIKSSLIEVQKRINEFNKAINAVEIIGDEDILNKLHNNKNDAVNEEKQLTELYNNKTVEAEEIYNKLINVSQLVR